MTKDIKESKQNNVTKSPLVEAAEKGHADIVSLLLTPDNVTIMVSLISAAIGITTTAINAIKLWVDERKSRKIRVRYQDLEIEISGSSSEDDILKKLEIFNSFKAKIKSEDMMIIIDDKKPNKAN